jgi:hypothetical protein
MVIPNELIIETYILMYRETKISIKSNVVILLYIHQVFQRSLSFRFTCGSWAWSLCFENEQVDSNSVIKSKYQTVDINRVKSHNKCYIFIMLISVYMHIPSSWIGTASIGFSNGPQTHNTNNPIVKETILAHT